MRRSVWVVLSLVCSLVFPSAAYASDIDYVGSFSNGFDAFLGNGENEPVTPEKDFNERYEPVEIEVTSELPQFRTTGSNDPIENIRTVTNRVNTLRWNVSNLNLLESIRIMFGARSGASSTALRQLVIVLPIGICFMWWGVRKAISMINSAFRKGRGNV